MSERVLPGLELTMQIGLVSKLLGLPLPPKCWDQMSAPPLSIILRRGALFEKALLSHAVLVPAFEK